MLTRCALLASDILCSCALHNTFPKLFVVEVPILLAPGQGIWKERPFNKMSKEAMCLLGYSIMNVVR